MVNNICTAFSFVRDPDTEKEQNEAWQSSEADKNIDDIDDTVNSAKMMKEFGTNKKGQYVHYQGAQQYGRQHAGAEKKKRLNSTLIYLEINKVDVEQIYQVKEAYLQLKRIAGCC